MRAYQCDRCGDFYRERQRSGIFVTDDPSVNKTMDLCPKCQEELKVWWNAGKAEESEENNEDSD